jgi:uncharacterized protein (DUF697 family)/predicted GTPase
VLSREVDPAVVDERLRAAKAALAPPVFWLLGKAQSGKTSLVRAMTQSSRAEIGNGFRPCTRAAQSYSFPSGENCLLQFLDCRGLGDAGHDAAEEVADLEVRADLIIVVIKAMDHALRPVLDVLRAVAARRKDRPVIVLQTTLHEGYPPGHARHVVPYPFTAESLPPSVPHDLARSLSAQRELFREFGARFVPVDFTLPEDGFEPADYGLEDLWKAIDELLPLGLRGMLGQTPEGRRAARDEHFRKAHPQIVAHALAAGGAGAVPLPAVDVPLVLAAQAKLLHTLGDIYNQPMSAQRMAEIAGALGFGFLTRLGLRELLKLAPVPGLGSSVSALYAAASTYALGMALCEYFSRVRGGAKLDLAVIRELYAAELQEGQLWIAERLRGQAP